MNTAHPRGVVATQSNPPESAPEETATYVFIGGQWLQFMSKAKESYFPVFEFVHKFWFPNNNNKESSGHLAYWEIKQPNQRSLDGEVTECVVCKHCGCMLNTDHISYYINQVP